MNLHSAVSAFAALAQETRLKVFKILIEYGRTGVAAGVISDRLDMPHNSLSFHLSYLKKAGLISSDKQGRSIIYRANVEEIENLIGYLNENCCVREVPSKHGSGKREGDSSVACCDDSENGKKDCCDS